MLFPGAQPSIIKRRYDDDEDIKPVIATTGRKQKRQKVLPPPADTDIIDVDSATTPRPLSLTTKPHSTPNPISANDPPSPRLPPLAADKPRPRPRPIFAHPPPPTSPDDDTGDPLTPPASTGIPEAPSSTNPPLAPISKLITLPNVECTTSDTETSSAELALNVATASATDAPIVDEDTRSVATTTRPITRRRHVRYLFFWQFIIVRS